MRRGLAASLLALALTGCTCHTPHPDETYLGVLSVDRGFICLPGGIVLYHDAHWFDDPKNWTKREPFYLVPERKEETR